MYSVTTESIVNPDGTTYQKKEVIYMPDENTVITKNYEDKRDLTDYELNEIMEELEVEQNNEINDNYPLKNIRKEIQK